MSERPKRGLFSTALLLLPLQIVFRAGEAVFPLLLAAWFGHSTATDVYQSVWAIFTFAGSLVFSIYQDSALVPLLAEVRTNGQLAVTRFTGSLLAHTLVFGGLLAVAIGALALLWFRLTYAPADFGLAAKMVVPFTIFLVALSVKTFFIGWLNAEHRYFAYPVASAFGVVVTLGLAFAGKDRLGVAAVPAASMVGEIVSATLLCLVARHAKLIPQLNLERTDAVRRFAGLMASDVGGGAVTRVNPVVDQLMATFAGVVGGGTLLRYSNDVATVPTSLLQATLLPVLLSHLSDDFVLRKIADIRAIVRRALSSVVLILAALAGIFYAIREPLLRLVFLHGQMDAAGIALMARILPYHLVGLAPFGALLVLSRAHVALKNTKIMISMGILNATLNALFNVVLLKWIGLEGIALSTSCMTTVIAIVFWFRLEAKLREESGAPSGVAVR